jgi:hypothetical protein
MRGANVTEPAAGDPAGNRVPVPGIAMRERHETSLPLLLSGAAITAACIPQLIWPGTWSLPGSWLAAALLTVAFAACWLTFRRRAKKNGGRYRRGFGIAALIGLVLSLPPLAIAVVWAGPFTVFGIGLLAAGVALSNRFLAWWAGLIGAVGIFEGFFGITNRLPLWLWAGWEHQAIFLFLGVATIAAGVITRLRENQARTAAVAPA